MGETKIGTSSSGAIHPRPGKSVRIIRKASMPPSGTAMTARPVARIMPFLKASQKSGSSKMKRKESRPRVLSGMKNGADRKLW